MTIVIKTKLVPFLTTSANVNKILDNIIIEILKRFTISGTNTSKTMNNKRVLVALAKYQDMFEKLIKNIAS